MLFIKCIVSQSDCLGEVWCISCINCMADTRVSMQNNFLAAISLLEFLCESEAEHASQKNFYIGLCTKRFVVVNSQ